MRKKLYCNYCNNSLRIEFLEGRKRQVCKNCGQVYYENPLPVASVIVSNDDHELLLVKRAREPFKDMWCFPIGFAETGESIEHAAIRELREEGGIDGKIVQLIDVDSHINSFYGELLIVTFEGEKLGGNECAGDDASDWGYFPAMNLPKLAFDSQEKALKKFLEIKNDAWNIHDSFEKFVKVTSDQESFAAVELLSDELIDIIEDNAERISELWLNDISTNPSIGSCKRLNREEILLSAMTFLANFRRWLKEKGSEGEFKGFFAAFGALMQKNGIPPEELISLLSLFKKHLFRFISSWGLWNKPVVEIYRIFELGERLVYIFDRAVYYAVRGYND